MYNNNYIKRLQLLQPDKLSQAFARYQIQVVAVGQFRVGQNQAGIRNTSLPWHRLIYVTRGQIQYEAGGSTVALQVGDVLYTPPRLIYSARSGQERAAFFYIYFAIQPPHLEADLVRLLEAEGRVRVFPAQQSLVELCFRAIAEEHAHRRPGCYQMIQHYMMLALLALVRDAPGAAAPVQEPRAAGSLAVLYRATALVAENLTGSLSVQQLSRACGVSENYLYKIFKSNLGIPPQQYILNCKVEYAQQMLLQNPALTITQVSRELGFCNANHFSNTFYRVTGQRPSALRRQNAPAEPERGQKPGGRTGPGEAKDEKMA